MRISKRQPTTRRTNSIGIRFFLSAHCVCFTLPSSCEQPSRVIFIVLIDFYSLFCQTSEYLHCNVQINQRMSERDIHSRHSEAGRAMPVRQRYMELIESHWRTHTTGMCVEEQEKKVGAVNRNVTEIQFRNRVTFENSLSWWLPGVFCQQRLIYLTIESGSCCKLYSFFSNFSKRCDIDWHPSWLICIAARDTKVVVE